MSVWRPLRLIGASTTLIVGLSVADALVYSLVGFIIGLLLYLVLIFPSAPCTS